MADDVSLETINFAEAFFTHNLTQWTGTPQPKFLFFARFVTTDSTDTKAITTAIKVVDRPKFQMDTHVLNQYNKRRIIQTHQGHSEIHMTIHDIADHRVHDFFQKYWVFYYSQGNYTKETQKTMWSYDKTIDKMLDNGMGYYPASSNNKAFLDHIEIYWMYGGKYNRWDLVNPIIKDYSPDGFDWHAMVETNEISLTIEYEGVLFSKINQDITGNGGGGGDQDPATPPTASGDTAKLAGFDLVADVQNSDGASKSGDGWEGIETVSMRPASISGQKARQQPVQKSNVRQVTKEKPEILRQAQGLGKSPPIIQSVKPQSADDGTVTATDPSTMFTASTVSPVANPYSSDVSSGALDIGPVTFGIVPDNTVKAASNISGSMLDVVGGSIGGSDYGRSLAASLLYYPNANSTNGQTVIRSQNGISFSNNALGVLNVSRDPGAQLGKKLSASSSKPNGVIDWTNL